MYDQVNENELNKNILVIQKSQIHRKYIKLHWKIEM